MSAEGGTRAVIAALVANAGIAVTKFAAYLLTSSSSMLAESVHSVADSGNQLLLLLGGRAAKKGATPRHPFGYGRERYVYAFLVSIVLFSVGGLFALMEAWHKFHDPKPITGQWWWVPIAVLIVGILLEGRSFGVAIQESKKAKGTRSWSQFVRTAKAPELPVILLEDLAALLGLVFALFGVSLTLLTDDGRWDASATALIGVLLVVVAVFLAAETKSLLIGEGAEPHIVQKVSTALVGSDHDAIRSIIHLKTMHLAPEDILVTAKVELTDVSSAEEVALGINEAERRAREAVAPLHLTMFIEPDISDLPPSAHTDQGDAR